VRPSHRTGPCCPGVHRPSALRTTASHHLGGHSLPGSPSGFFLRFSLWRLPQLSHSAGVYQGRPNLRCFATFSARLELRPLPVQPLPIRRGASPTGVTRLPRCYGSFRHPIAPSLTVTGLRLVAATDHAIGVPVLRACPLCACCRHYPGTASGRSFRSLHQTYQPSPHGWAGRAVQRPFRGLLSVHSRYGLHTRQVTKCDPLYQRLQPLRYLLDCSDCFWPERHLPGGTFTQWKTPPLHGAHPFRSFEARQQRIPEYVCR
jgi:hypothetical protein